MIKCPKHNEDMEFCNCYRDIETTRDRVMVLMTWAICIVASCYIIAKCSSVLFRALT